MNQKQGVPGHESGKGGVRQGWGGEERRGRQDPHSLANVVLVCKLLIVEAELVNKIGRHLLHLIIRKGLATPGPVTVT